MKRIIEKKLVPEGDAMVARWYVKEIREFSEVGTPANTIERITFENEFSQDEALALIAKTQAKLDKLNAIKDRVVQMIQQDLDRVEDVL